MQLSSKKIADDFNLHHRSVLRSIRRLRGNEIFKDLFTETTYEHRGTILPAFLVSEFGFALLVSRFKIDNHKKIAYYLERYVESERNRRTNEHVKIIAEKMELELKLYDYKNRNLWQRIWNKEVI